MANEDQASADAALPDFSAVEASPAPSYWRPARSKPLRGVQRSIWWPLLLCVAVLQLTGIPFGPLMPLAVGHWTWIIGWYMCVYSVVPAQICLLNIGLVLGPGPLSRRVLVYWTAFLLMLVGWYVWWDLAKWVSASALNVHEPLREFAEMGLWLPIYVATLQLPLWGLRFWIRDGLANQRIGSNADLSAAQSTWQKWSQFSMRDLLIALGLLGITCGFGRWLWFEVFSAIDEQPSQGWIALWLRTACIAFAIVPPIIVWLSMAKQASSSDWRFSYFAAWFLTVLYSIGITVVGTAIFVWFERIPFDGGAKYIIMTMTAGFAIPLLCGLHVLRHYGWHLSRPRRGQS